jgi:hypothetical protein
MEIRPLTHNDFPLLQIFCDECKSLGWKNNESFEAMKLNSTVMPYGQFFIALVNNKIFSAAGVHQFQEVSPKAWRCLFRGAQLPGYTPKWSMNIFNSGIHWSYFLYEQIKFVQKIDNDSEFYITTNVDNPSAGSSSRLDKIMMPRLEKQGYCSLYQSNVILYNTMQNIWKVNVEKYLEDRGRWQNTLAI